ncbi:hypothetical protein BJX96DRAFT_172939 [Aspergillus floccosus]
MGLKKKDWELARTVKDPDRVREVLSQEYKPDAFDLCEAARHRAVYTGAVETVELLLATGAIDVNARPDYADLTNAAGVEDGWASSDKSSLPDIFKDPDGWYPLHLALTYSRVRTASSDNPMQKPNMTRMATALVQHGADLMRSFARQSGSTGARVTLARWMTTRLLMKIWTWESSSLSVETSMTLACAGTNSGACAAASCIAALTQTLGMWMGNLP